MPDAPRYPTGTVRALIESDAVTAPTRAALLARLDAPAPGAPRFLDAGAFATLAAACARLLRPAHEGAPLAVAAGIDARLADGEGNGWRYDALPPDGEAYRLGLRGLDEAARAAGSASFAALDGERQDAILAAVQRGDVAGGVWPALPAARWFEEWLAETCELHYAHPLAQERIGYAGMADAPGWPHVGPGELEPREPRPL